MLQEGCRRLPNARPKPLDLYPASTSSPTLSSMALLISQEWNRFTGSTEDLALQLSIIIYIYSSVPGPMFLRLTWTLISPFYFGCLRLLTHLQDSTCTSPPWLPRLSWVPLFRPHPIWHTCVEALRFRIATSQAPGLYIGALVSQSPASHSSFCHFLACILCLTCIMHLPVFLLSLSHSPTCFPLIFSLSAYILPQPTYSQHIPLPTSIFPTSSHPSPYLICGPLPNCTLACSFPHQPISSSPDSSSIPPVKGRISSQLLRFLALDMYTPSPRFSIKL